MLSIRVRGLAETREALERFPTRLVPRLVRVGGEALAYAATLARTRYLSGPTSTFLEPRRGTLRASWTRGHPLNIYRLTQQGLVVDGETGTSIPWAASHETDQTITAHALEVPPHPLAVCPHRTWRAQKSVSGGECPESARDVSSPGGSIWQVLTSRRGRARAQVVPIFVLKRSVFRKARPVKVPVEQATQPWLETRTALTLADAEVRTNIELKREAR